IATRSSIGYRRRKSLRRGSGDWKSSSRCWSGGRRSIPEGRARGLQADAGALQIAVGPFVEQLTRRFERPAQRREGEGAADRDAPDPGIRQLGHRWSLWEGEDVDRQVDRLDDPADVLEPAEAGRVENVGARLLVGLQAGDRVGEVGDPVEVVL